MGIQVQFQHMSSFFTRASSVSRKIRDSSATRDSKDNMVKSQESLEAASQASFLMSEGSSQSEYSIRSATSLQSESNISSQLSIQSQPSSCSNSSLASIPSLGIIDHESLRTSDGGTIYRCVATLRGHGGCVFSLAMEGNLLYSGSSGNNIRVWRNPELNGHCQFGHGDGAVKCILLSGDRIYSAHQDHRIRVWKRAENMLPASGHKLMATMPTLKDYAMNALLPNKYVQVRRHRKALWIEHVDTISALSVDRNGFLYSASWDRTVKIWRPSDLRCVESFRAHDDAINALVVSPDGFVYTGSADSRIKIWAKASGERKHSLVATLERHKSAINALALSPNGSILYSGACDRSIIVWERAGSARHMTVSGALRGHKSAILCLASVAEFLCSGSADNTIRVWKRGEGNAHYCLAVLEGHRGPVKSIAASVDAVMGCHVYSGSLDHDIKVWWVSSNSRCSDDHEDAYNLSPLKTIHSFESQ